jgi:glucose-1-phosphate thymidylyltransferase
MWGIIPAAGAGSRIQPLAFSKELLPVGSRFEGDTERPRAVSEYIIERMIRAGAKRICLVISPGKCDILEYYGASFGPARLFYVVQPQPSGLCDALFCALPLIAADDRVMVGLPDTIWFPEDGFSLLPLTDLSFLLFPVTRPELFDVVLTDEDGRVRQIRVKAREPLSHWVWGAFQMSGSVMLRLHELWCRRGRGDEYVGTLVNAYLGEGGQAWGTRAGSAYVDVGTLYGYREAIRLLSGAEQRLALQEIKA